MKIGDDDPSSPGEACPGHEKRSHRTRSNDQHVVADLEPRPAHRLKGRTRKSLGDRGFGPNVGLDPSPGVRTDHLNLAVAGVRRVTVADLHARYLRAHL